MTTMTTTSASGRIRHGEWMPEMTRELDLDEGIAKIAAEMGAALRANGFQPGSDMIKTVAEMEGFFAELHAAAKADLELIDRKARPIGESVDAAGGAPQVAENKHHYQ